MIYRYVVALVSVVFTVLSLLPSRAAANIWTPTAGPEGAEIRALALDANKILYMVTAKGVYFTADGVTWTDISYNLPRAYALAINSSGTLYAATRGFVYSWTGGIIWTKLTTTTELPGSLEPWALAFGPGSTPDLYCAGDGGGLFKYTFTQNTWQEVTGTEVPADRPSVISSIVFRKVGLDVHIYAGSTLTGVFWWNGSSWNRNSSYDLGALATTSTGVIYGATERGTNKGVYLNNSLNDWTLVDGTVQGGTICINSLDEIFVGTVSGIYRNTGSGFTHLTAVAGDASGGKLNHTMVANAPKVYARVGSGVNYSPDDGASWYRWNTGLTQTSMSVLWKRPADGRIYAGGTTEVWWTDDNGQNWTLGAYPIPFKSTITSFAYWPAPFGNGDALFVGVQDGGVYRSGDDGVGWSIWNDAVLDQSLDVHCLVVSTKGLTKGKIYAGTESGLYYTDIIIPPDNDPNWRETIDSDVRGRQITSIGVNLEGHLFATVNGRVKRSDNGIDWTDMNLDATIVGVGPFGNLYATLSNGEVYRSDDEGVTWIAVGVVGTNGQNVTAFAFNTTGHVLCLTDDPDQKVFSSANKGITWEDISKGLPAFTDILSIVVSRYGTALASVSGNGVFRTTQALPSTPNCIDPPPGMVGWWAGDNHASDLSNHLNNGSLVNGATYASPGEVADAFDLTASLSYISIPDPVDGSLDMDEGPFSIDAWIRTGSINRPTIVDKRQNAGSAPIGYSFFVQETGELGLQLANGTTFANYLVTGAPAVNDNAWRHVATTVVRGSVPILYINGIAYPVGSSVIVTGSISNSSPFSIGAQFYTGQRSFEGLVDEVEVFKRALSAQEIADIYNAGQAGKCKPACLSKPISYDLKYTDHWNLVSVPALVSDYSVNVLFPGAILSTTYEYRDHNNPLNESYYPRTTLDNIKGFWTKFTVSQNIPLSGFLLCEVYVPLYTGWNLVPAPGWEIHPEKTRTEPLGIRDSKFSGYLHGSGYFDAQVLTPGAGYWVHANAPGNLIYSALYPETPPRTLVGSSLDISTRCNSISFSDARGNHQSLFIVKRGDRIEDIDLYKTPPPPPRGVFDVRFLSGKMIELLKNESGTRESYDIEVSEASYPLVIDLHATGDEYQSATISEIVGERIVKSHRFPTNGSLRIDNAGVTRFRLTIESTTASTPTEFSLCGIYPNPFNPTTSIQFDLPTNALVTLQVFDLLGREIASLADHRQYGPGKHVLEFNAPANASGIYIARFTALSEEKIFTDVKKMVIVK